MLSALHAKVRAVVYKGADIVFIELLGYTAHTPWNGCYLYTFNITTHTHYNIQQYVKSSKFIFGECS